LVAALLASGRSSVALTGCHGNIQRRFARLIANELQSFEIFFLVAEQMTPPIATRRISCYKRQSWQMVM